MTIGKKLMKILIYAVVIFVSPYLLFFVLRLLAHLFKINENLIILMLAGSAILVILFFRIRSFIREMRAIHALYQKRKRWL